MVTLIWLWPRISITTRGETPWTSSNVTHVFTTKWGTPIEPRNATRSFNSGVEGRHGTLLEYLGSDSQRPAVKPGGRVPVRLKDRCSNQAELRRLTRF